MGTPVEAVSGKKKQNTLQWVAYLISALCLWWVYHNFEWRDELPQIEEWFEFIGEKLPTGVKDEFEALKQRLAEAD